MKTVAQIPGPRRPLPGLSFLRMRGDPIGYLGRLARDYGDVVQFKLGTERMVLLSHPEAIKEVLVNQQHSFKKGRALERAKLLLGEGLLTSEGELHTRQRRLAQPAFHRGRVAGYGGVMVGYAARLRDCWFDGVRLDVHAEMMRLTLAIVGKTLFGADVEGEADEVGEAMTAVMGLFNLLMLPFAPLLQKLPLPPNRRFDRARERLDATIYRIIRERRASREDTGDLLSILLLAEDTEGDGTGMTDVQLRDEILTLFLAGHETTAVALSWTWYLLSQHAEAEARLHAELDAVLAGRLPTADDLPHLTHAEMVFSEAMRLYPPAWIVGRRALRDTEVGGVLIPRGTIVLMSQYLVHRDPRFFPEPERFDPLRWTPEARAARPKFSYFPFGGGSRQCIGEGFAWMEGVLLLATIAQQWSLRLSPDHPVAVQPVITLRPKGGMPMTVHRRA